MQVYEPTQEYEEDEEVYIFYEDANKANNVVVIRRDTKYGEVMR